MYKTMDIHQRRVVLVVEDQEINRDVLGMILEDDYDVLYAADGAEAMVQIRNNLDRLSLILLDLLMPVMDGFEVLERVRDDPDMRRIPIIVLTAEKKAELRALQLGAADFITKPYDMHEVILARVKRIIELSEGKQLIRATERDSLTQLYSSQFFFEYAERIQKYHPEREMDAVAVNIERFHMVNELNGREFGDRLLRTVGDELIAFLRDTEGIAGRGEADQFFVYCRRQEDYSALLHRLQTRVNSEMKRVGIRLRMGVSPWSDDVTVVQLFDRARLACGMVRGKFQTPLMVYDQAVRERDLYYQRLMNDLDAAVEERQLIVYYQPKYDIKRDPPRLQSAEALIRWKHPELGMISPGDFIPLLENNGLVHVVDNYVWKEAARQIAVWRDTLGFTLPVSVNLSRVDVFDPNLEADLLEIVRSNGLLPGNLKLEVTESSYTEDADQLIAVINHLRDDGFEIEMDDFGSGYSSLNMISALPIDVLKMDMKFIQNIRENNEAFRLVEVILDIARYLNVPVVAEGVETELQLSLLRSAECDYVQGYYFSRPLPPEDFAALILKELETAKTRSA